MNKLIAEFIGTGFLVLTIACVVMNGAQGVIPPIAIGVALMSMIYACGHISGAHFNPAVTIAVLVRGRIAPGMAAAYIVVQIVAAVLIALLVDSFLDAPAPINIKNVPAALIGEFLFCFALCWVVLNVATAKANAGNGFYGAAIAGVVVAGAFAVGSISGAAFNPAVAFGLVTMKFVGVQNVWIHLVSDTTAGVVAGLAFRAVHPNDR